MPGAYQYDAAKGSYIRPPEDKLPHYAHVSLSGHVTTRCYCDLSCRWATEKPSCLRERAFLLDYFKKHGAIDIVDRSMADIYPRCPMYEAKPAGGEG